RVPEGSSEIHGWRCRVFGSSPRVLTARRQIIPQPRVWRSGAHALARPGDMSSEAAQSEHRAGNEYAQVSATEGARATEHYRGTASSVANGKRATSRSSRSRASLPSLR